MSVAFKIKASDAADARLDPEYHNALRNTHISSHYPCVKLVSLAYFRTGGTPSTQNAEFWGGDVPWVSAKDFKAFRFEDSEDHITEAAVRDGTTCYVTRPAMLLVGRSGILQHTLPVMVTHKPTAINQDIKAFFPDDRVTVDYLGAFFIIFGTKLLPFLCKSGATVQSLNTEQLMDVSIPVPPLPVQQKIIAELDAAYAAKRAADEKAAKLLASIDDMVLKELGIAKLPKPDTSLASRIFTVSAAEVSSGRFDSHYYSPCFGKNENRIHAAGAWCLGEVVELSHQQWDQKCWMNDDGATFPYIEIGAISVADGEIDRVEDVEIKNAPSRAKMVVEKGDLLVSLTRPTRRAIAFASEKAVASTGFAVIRKFSSDILPEYLFSVLRSELCTYQFDQRSTGGNYPAITEEQLLKCVIPKASIALQERIASKASAIRAEARKLKSDAATALEKAKRKIESGIVGK